MRNSVAHQLRPWWPAVVVGALAVLGACSEPEHEKTPPGPSAVAQAHSAYSALASVQAANDEHAQAQAAMPTPEDASGAPDAGSPPGIVALNLYEVGAEGFFLERAEAIGLSADAIEALTAIKEKAVLAQLATQHEIDTAEQHLRMLTFAATPDPTAIDAQISEIGRLGTHQRMAYVRAVGRAIAVLDDSQRAAIRGPM